MKTSIFYRIQFGMVLAALPLVAIGFDANAQTNTGYTQETDAGERVNYSGKLRMLSQRIVASSCNYVAGIEQEKSEHDMRAAQEEFDLIARALVDGNSELGIIGEEKRRKTLARHSALVDVWQPISVDLTAISDGIGATDHLASLVEESGSLLNTVQLLASEISAQYSNPSAMLQADVMLVNYASRQRMLAQRMSKDVCLVASGFAMDTAQSELAATAVFFETTLFALRGGKKDVGINPPPNTQIAQGLNAVVEQWEALKPAIDTVLSGGTLSASGRAIVYNGINKMTADMNSVVGLYAKASKRAGT